jgi:glucosamine--fructose-6-phosphate aminotransferase (isomerizing)
MCGIFGAISNKNITKALYEGLAKLEYRGYDSAGIAWLDNNKNLSKLKAKGKLINLKTKLDEAKPNANIGIAHTRWATHGAANETNAHPHMTENLALVHNGIIENYQELKKELNGVKFKSETDSEVILHHIDKLIKNGQDKVTAVNKTIEKLDGTFALAIMFNGEENTLIGAKKGSPLAVGYGIEEMFLGSDAIALSASTNKVSYLEEGDMVIMSKDNIKFIDKNKNEVTRKIITSNAANDANDKGEYKYYMEKEIHEQASVISKTLSSLYDTEKNEFTLNLENIDFNKANKINIIACGTSYYAGVTAKYWIEKYAKIPVEVDIASEFRYRNPALRDGDISIFISQSGETADSLAALRFCKELNQQIISIVNVPMSSIARESDAVIQTLAGAEIGVASTKAFTTQLTALANLALFMGINNKTIKTDECETLLSELKKSSTIIGQIINKEESNIENIAKYMSDKKSALFLGRGTAYPIAMEGALKLKEISYIHAEAYASGEMKHGPIALIDENMPVIVLAPEDELFEKSLSNMQEVAARNGKVILISSKKGCEKAKDIAYKTICIPEANSFINPILYVISVQLLALHTAIAVGNDVDKPRNLAKSVTVE